MEIPLSGPAGGRGVKELTKWVVVGTVADDDNDVKSFFFGELRALEVIVRAHARNVVCVCVWRDGGDLGRSPALGGGGEVLYCFFFFATCRIA